MTQHRRIGGGFSRGSPSLIIIGRLGASALALVSAPIVARAIGPEGRGETAAALALFLIVPVALGMGIPLEVRRQAATSDGHAVIRTGRTFVTLSVAGSVAIAALSYLTIFADFSTGARMTATVGIALAPLTTSWSLDVSVLVAHRRYSAVLIMQILQPAVYVGLVVLLWTIGLAMVATVIMASIAGTAATFAAGLILVRVPLRGQRVGMKILIQRGFSFFGSAIAEAASNRADQILALPLIGAYQAGLYSVAATIGSIPLAIGQALGASYFTPIAQTEGIRRREIQSESIRAAMAAAVMATPVIAAIAWATIPLVFGDAFAPSILPTMLALIGSAGLLIGYVASMGLAAEGRGVRMTIAQVTSVIVGIGALSVLGPALGAVGAAVASTVGYLALLVASLALLQIRACDLVPRPRDFGATVKRLKRDD